MHPLPGAGGDEKSGEPAKPEMLVQSHPQTESVKIPVIPVVPERKPEPEIPAEDLDENEKTEQTPPETPDGETKEN